MTLMKLTLSKQKNTNVLHVTGDVTHAVSPEFQSTALDALSKEANLVLDFSEIGLLTSAGLRTLLLLHREALASKKNLILAAVSDSAQDIMKVTGFWEQFVSTPSVETALHLIETH